LCFSWLRQCTTAIQVDAQRRLDEYKASCDNLISLSYPEDQRLEFGADATVTQSNAQGDLIAEGTVWCGTSLSGTRSTVLVTPKSGAFVTGIVLNFTTENGVDITNPGLQIACNPPTLQTITAIGVIDDDQRTIYAMQKMTAERGEQWAGGVFVGSSALVDDRNVDHKPIGGPVGDLCPMDGGYENLWQNARDADLLGADQFEKNRLFLHSVMKARGITGRSSGGHPALEGLHVNDCQSIASCVKVLKKYDELSIASIGGNAALNEFNLLLLNLPTFERDRMIRKRIEDENVLREWYLFCSFFLLIVEPCGCWVGNSSDSFVVVFLVMCFS